MESLRFEYNVQNQEWPVSQEAIALLFDCIGKAFGFLLRWNTTSTTSTQFPVSTFEFFILFKLSVKFRVVFELKVGLAVPGTPATRLRTFSAFVPG